MKVTKILPLTYSFDNGNVRFFLLIGKEKALLIDSGDGEENVREVFSEYTDLPLILANTHIGNNHIGGNEYFPFFYLSPSDSFLFYNIYKRRGVIKPLYDGDVISLGDRDVEVISLSGHTPGSVVFLDKETGSIFSGDSISSSPVSFFLSILILTSI